MFQTRLYMYTYIIIFEFSNFSLPAPVFETLRALPSAGVRLEKYEMCVLVSSNVTNHTQCSEMHCQGQGYIVTYK